MFSVVFTSTEQHGPFVHLLPRYDMYLFVGAIRMICLHAQSWKIFWHLFRQCFMHMWPVRLLKLVREENLVAVE